ncbi:MAG TPA: hypothetical protein PKL84_16225, partial [Candidatus Hydrogenedentes bacterium]|nr:hypothetical protein [Candidatus Hydrogenedentota bacterium]
MACNPFKIVVPGALWLVLISVACSGPSSPQHETGSSVEPEAVAPGGDPGNATTPGKWEEEVD